MPLLMMLSHHRSHWVGDSGGGVQLRGQLPEWVSAKDVVLEMLRRHGVDGGVHRVIEYHGPGLRGLTAMDRHVIANMGAELGATTTVFPADDAVRTFLRAEGREDAFRGLAADPDAAYDVTDTVDLSTLEPLIARPSSPGNVVPVREVAGEPVSQVVIGSSANPGGLDCWNTRSRMQAQPRRGPRPSRNVRQGVAAQNPRTGRSRLGTQAPGCVANR